MSTETTAREYDNFVDLLRLKAHLRVDIDVEDALITEYAIAAIDYLERATNRIIAPSTIRYTVPQFPSGAEALQLPIGPARSITSITYEDDGDTQSINPDHYMLNRGTPSGRIIPTTPWPDVGSPDAQIAITYTAGYATQGDCPPLLMQGIFLLAGHYYEQRAATSDRTAIEVPFAFAAIVDRFRIPVVV
ncbi:MAG: head-tail connector protein [Planctomycetota bacterium]